MSDETQVGDWAPGVPEDVETPALPTMDAPDWQEVLKSHVGSAAEAHIEDAAAPSAVRHVDTGLDARAVPGPSPEPATVDTPTLPSGAAATGSGASGPGAMDPEVLEGMRRVEERIASLHADRLTLETMVRGLQTRNEELQGDLVMRALAPVVKELAALLGQANRLSVGAAERYDDAVAKDVAFDFDDFAERIRGAAESMGVEAMDVRVNDSFDRKRHQAAGRVPTLQPELDKKVASVTHDGFWAPGTEKPIVYAKVRVFQYQELDPTTTEFRAAAAPTPQPTLASTTQTGQDNKENEL